MERVFIPDGFDISKPIFRYMPLTGFLKMLETRRFRVAQRKTFSDALESKLDLKRQFMPVYVGEGAPKPDETSIKEDIAKINMKSKLHGRHSDLLVSCWTTKQDESMMMWQCYAQKIGVRIQSDASSFISAIDCRDIDCLCSGIAYERDDWNHSAVDILFAKHPAYRDEEEVRFYFANIDEEKDCIMPIDDNGINSQKCHNFPINLEYCIHNVMLSPFIDACVAQKLARWIKRDYGIYVRLSSIQISQ